MTTIAEPDAPATLVLGRYRALERLGAGGFGVVWRAHDELLHREVALKRIPQGSREEARRASREALAAARLSHPAIVALYEACAEGDAFYLISELVEGETLAQLIAGEALEDRLTLDIGIDLAQALRHAHARGVIHRDVKPQNVLVPKRTPGQGRGGAAAVAKLTDFGGARLAGEQALTRTGDVLGTIAYMAPEQSEGFEADERADLYSLALVLYEALSGVNPVRGATPAETARRVGGPLEPLESSRRDLPRSLTRALDRALDPDPGARGSLGDLELELLDAQASSSFCRPRPPTVRVIDRRPAAPAHRDPHVSIRPEAEPALPFPAPSERASETARGWLARAQRLLWRGGALAVIVWQLASGRSGLALVLAAALLPVLLVRRPGLALLGALLAPALGVVGLAGAFPALAAQSRRWVTRALVAALGYWWLVLAEPLLGLRLWWGEPAGASAVARATWEGSPGMAGAHVLGPLATLSTLAGMALWAAAAALLPWLVRGRHALTDAILACAWSGGLVAACARVQQALHHAHSITWPHGALLGALAGALVALTARAVRGPAPAL